MRPFARISSPNDAMRASRLLLLTILGALAALAAVLMVSARSRVAARGPDMSVSSASKRETGGGGAFSDLTQPPPPAAGTVMERRTATPGSIAVKAATALVSLVAVIAASAYLISPTGTALAVQIAVDPSAQVVGGQIVVYGKATDSTGKPLAGVGVVLSVTGKVKLKLKSGPDGTYRNARALTRAKYTIAVSSKVKGKTTTTKITATLKPGHAYRITVRLVHSGGLSILPIRSY